jgi:hypothetical protein
MSLHSKPTTVPDVNENDKCVLLAVRDVLSHTTTTTSTSTQPSEVIDEGGVGEKTEPRITIVRLDTFYVVELQTKEAKIMPTTFDAFNALNKRFRVLEDGSKWEPVFYTCYIPSQEDEYGHFRVHVHVKDLCENPVDEPDQESYSEKLAIDTDNDAIRLLQRIECIEQSRVLDCDLVQKVLNVIDQVPVEAVCGLLRLIHTQSTNTGVFKLQIRQTTDLIEVVAYGFNKLVEDSWLCRIRRVACIDGDSPVQMVHYHRLDGEISSIRSFEHTLKVIIVKTACTGTVLDVPGVGAVKHDVLKYVVRGGVPFKTKMQGRTTVNRPHPYGMSDSDPRDNRWRRRSRLHLKRAVVSDPTQSVLDAPRE